MATDLTKNEFVEILLDTEITKPTDINIFMCFTHVRNTKLPQAMQAGC